jgi:phage-related protein
MMMRKSIHRKASSLDDLRSLPARARREFGLQLQMVQRGDEPLDWKPMSTVGPAVMELRARQGGEFRVLFVATFREAIYVLHCFQKKTQQTSGRDIETARRRYAEVVASRRSSVGEGS